MTGYQCTDTEDVVDHPRQCPCPGYKAMKCEPIKPTLLLRMMFGRLTPSFPTPCLSPASKGKADDWYVCVPAGTKCAEVSPLKEASLCPVPWWLGEGYVWVQGR